MSLKRVRRTHEEKGSAEISVEGIKYTAITPELESRISILINAPKYKQWLKKIRYGINDNPEIMFNHVHLTDVTMFGSNLGFAKFDVMLDDGKPTDMDGNIIPGNVIFLRGNAAAVLAIVSAIENPFEKLVVICGQIRVPAGGFIYEACAGMADDVTGDLKGVMIKEMEEELGIRAHQSENQSYEALEMRAKEKYKNTDYSTDDLIDLGTMIPSAGGCDETISLYAIECSLSVEKISEMKMTMYGEENTDESIKLRFVDYNKFDDVLDEIGDPKAECIWRRYQRFNMKR